MYIKKITIGYIKVIVNCLILLLKVNYVNVSVFIIILYITLYISQNALVMLQGIVWLCTSKTNHFYLLFIFSFLFLWGIA